jgi:hypothetical protein
MLFAWGSSFGAKAGKAWFCLLWRDRQKCNLLIFRIYFSGVTGQNRLSRRLGEQSALCGGCFYYLRGFTKIIFHLLRPVAGLAAPLFPGAAYCVKRVSMRSAFGYYRPVVHPVG